MVVMSMFKGVEEKARVELKQLYQDFLADPTDSSLEERALHLEQEYAGREQLSKEVSLAGHRALAIALGEMGSEEAREILSSLE